MSELMTFWIVVLRTSPDLIYEVEQTICQPQDVGLLLINYNLYHAVFTELQRAKNYAAQMNAATGSCPVTMAFEG